MIGCAQVTPVVAAETEPPRWHPSISIENLNPNTTKAKMEFKNPDFEFEMHKTSFGSWTVELSEEQLKELLAEENSKMYTVIVKYQLVSSKGISNTEIKEFEVLIKKPSDSVGTVCEEEHESHHPWHSSKAKDL
jgi:hypothetical protein